MRIAESALQYRTVTLVLTLTMIVGGIQAYMGLSRLEDPEFTIKTAVVMTPYPGASAREVAEEVSDRIETAIQQMGEVDYVTSKSDRGLSEVTVEIRSDVPASALPQVWDELRRKVGDVQGDLPPGAGESLVVDDFGDVYGVFLAVYGEEFSYAELKVVTDMLRRELLLVDDVAKVETYGELQEVIYVIPDIARMSQLGLSPDAVSAELRARNLVSDGGRFYVGVEDLAIEPTGVVTDVSDFETILISPGESSQVQLGDVAEIRRGYADPPRSLLRYQGHPAIGLGISTVQGGNVVVMGEGLDRRLAELEAQIPLGVEIGVISHQADSVKVAIRGFLVSLAQAVAIVIVVLLFAMGLRAGLIIGGILLITVVGTFIFMAPWGVALERISLGALIIALGMLVDNAIVVVDGTQMRMRRGMSAEDATKETVRLSAMPLLGATVVAILAFAAIGTSSDSTGEFCRSLFQVVLISLLLSWVTAVTVTPLACVMFLKEAPPDEGAGSDPYDTAFYRLYRSGLTLALRERWATTGVVVGLFVIATWAFGMIPQSFFPSSTRPQFMVDVWLPTGTRIERTQQVAHEIEALVQDAGGERVSGVTSFIGKGGLRFLLTYNAEKFDSSYIQFLIDVPDAGTIPELMDLVDTELNARFPDALIYASAFQLGPGSTGKIQTRITGPDPSVVRALGEQVVDLYRANGNIKAIRSDWRDMLKLIQPVIAEDLANRAGVTRSDIAGALAFASTGRTIGVFREADLLLPILFRADEAQRADVATLDQLQLWSPAARGYIPLTQVVPDIETSFEDAMVWRRNRQPTLTVFGDPIHGQASEAFAAVRPEIEALELPTGYHIEWGGEYEDSSEANEALAAKLPVFVLAMILIVIVMFNALRQPLIIWLTVPLAVIGVSAGLLVTGQPFGFMALLGFLSLMGMLIKNAVVLVDQIDQNVAEGIAPLEAIIDAGVSRANPVAMAALTTVLGMVPLLGDAFFVAMAVTIMGGLTFATLLTLIYVPVMYSILFRVDTRLAA